MGLSFVILLKLILVTVINFAVWVFNLLNFSFIKSHVVIHGPLVPGPPVDSKICGAQMSCVRCCGIGMHCMHVFPSL